MTVTKTVLTVSGIILTLLFLLPIFIYGVLNTGNYMGLLISLSLLFYGIFFCKINSFVKAMFARLYGKIILLTLAAVILFMFIFAVVVSFNMAIKANSKTDSSTTVVVLGCRVRESGPSLMLKSRLNAAYRYLKENPDADCVLSGGQGEDEPMAEGRFMYDWLVEKGIDKNRLYVEDRSTSTEENLEFSKMLIAEKGLEPKITIITNDFHQYRAYRFAREYGIESYACSAKTPFLLFPTYYIREICGVAHMIFIGSD